MDRLTIVIDDGFDEVYFEVPSDREGAYNILDIAKYSSEKEMQEILLNVAHELAEYEDIGLTPDEIRDLQEQNKRWLEKLEKYEWEYGSVDTAMFYAELQGKC